ncbi:MAG: hypothetical protein QXH37_05115, partial [Candidatus Bathyarchaeia archaeon]
MNRKAMAVHAIITMLVLMIFSQLVPLQVYAVNVEITSISPATKTGKVGEPVSLIGTINRTDGAYQVWFGDIQVASGSASGNNVICSFNVPPLPNGNYTLTLHDVTADINATSWFYIETDYIVDVSKPPHPEQFQEGATPINISVSVTGGKANTVYAANVTVKTPANETYWKFMHLSNTTDTGTGNASLRYPEDFGGNPHTNYTGTYTVYFNGTLASTTFFIGLTDRTEYHRGDLVKIKAVDYSSLNGANVTITIKFGSKTIDCFNYTVHDAAIETNWTIPDTALVGNYSLSITPKPVSKKVNDTQVFAIPGFKTEIVPRNLAGEPVPSVLVRVYDKWANVTYNVTSSENGVANIWLEKGEYNSTAYFKKVKVSEVSPFNITDEGKKIYLQCQITNLNITVVSEQNIAIKIPFVSLNLTYTYTLELDGGENKNETVISQTDFTGTVQFRSLLLNAHYIVVASRYGKTFNQNNKTFSGLNPVPWNNVTIICPVKPLQVDVIDVNNAPITDAFVDAQELMGGLHDASYTGQNGRAVLNCVFGIYNVKVYSGEVLLNATTVEVFEDKALIIRCALY